MFNYSLTDATEFTYKRLVDKVNPWDVECAEEGLWRKLTYNFTTDFKCAALIDALIRKLSSMDTESATRLANKKIDFRMQDAKLVKEIMSFANISMTWAKQNLQKLKDILAGNGAFDAAFGSVEYKRQARQRFYQMKEMFESRYDDLMSEVRHLTSGEDAAGKSKVAKGKTYTELGLDKPTVLVIAKQFKTECSGNLKVMKQVAGIAGVSSHHTEFTGSVYVDTYYPEMLPVIDILNLGLKCYKYVDYFLYYTAKEVN